MPKIKRDDRKLRELILYVAKRTENDPSCGAVKLNKILYHAEFRAYLELGQPISGHPYVALELGPGPKGLVPIRANLVDMGDAEIEEETIGPRTQVRIRALRDAHTDLFTPAELALVDTVIRELRPLDWKMLSDRTHLTPGYIAAGKGNIIPYTAAFFSNDTTPDDDARARELQAKHHWA